MIREKIKRIIHSKCESCGAVANLPTEDKDWRADSDTEKILESLRTEIEQMGNPYGEGTVLGEVFENTIKAVKELLDEEL